MKRKKGAKRVVASLWFRLCPLTRVPFFDTLMSQKERERGGRGLYNSQY